jgi:hypothetical protein
VALFSSSVLSSLLAPLSLESCVYHLQTFSYILLSGTDSPYLIISIAALLAAVVTAIPGYLSSLLAPVVSTLIYAMGVTRRTTFTA